MSINTILSTAASGMAAAQAGIRTVSDNVANATTPGYVRKVVNQTSMVSQGAGAGVNIEGVARVVDRYLQSASLSSSSSAGKAGMLSEILDRTQTLFGDPSGTSNFFMGVGDVFADMAALANDPTSSLSRSQAITAIESFFDDSTRIATSLQQMQGETDTRIRSSVTRANDLLSQIAKLNGDIRAARISGTDSSGAENIQSQLIDELSGLVNLQVNVDGTGGTVLRTQDGALLADQQAATLTYHQSGAGAGYLTVTPPGSTQTFDAIFSSGELTGLLQARNEEIPGALAQLSEFSAAVAREINRAHNASTATPAPASLTGRNTGLDMPTAVGGFSGITTIALMNSSGVIQNRVQINFTTNQITVNAGAPAAFTPANFMATLTTAMTGAGGTATFNNGALTLGATAGQIAISDDVTTPSNKMGMGFSHFFGLNDLVRSSTLPLDTGLSGASAHGFTTGQTMKFRLTDANGVRVRDIDFQVPAGATVEDLRVAMNLPGNGVSPYGQFVLTNGRMAFESGSSPSVTLSVVEDLTSRGAGGPSVTSLFGLGIGGKVEAASGYSIDSKVYQNPALLATAKLNLVATGVAYAPGDGRGALEMATAGEQATVFGRAGGLPSGTMTLSRYASEVAGSLGRRAGAAQSAMDAAVAVKTEAANRRSSFEGVNTDEELIKLTTYQQAFNASARLIQASNDLYDTLLGMVG